MQISGSSGFAVDHCKHASDLVHHCMPDTPFATFADLVVLLCNNTVPTVQKLAGDAARMMSSRKGR